MEIIKNGIYYMRHLKKYGLLEDILKFGEFINEVKLEAHYLERLDLRVDSIRFVDKDGGNYSTTEAIERIQFLLKHLGATLLEQYPTTQESKFVAINFGDIKIKSGDNYYLPTLAVKKEKGKQEEYQGSVLVAITTKNMSVTVDIFDRKTSIDDIKEYVYDHTKRKGISDRFEFVEHVYLKDKENIIDMDVPFDVFKKQVIGETAQMITIKEESKEMVFAPGTVLKYYRGDEIVEKTIKRTERNAIFNGLTIPLRIYFEDNSFKSFKKEDRFIVTPAKKTASDKAKKERLNISGENFVGRIYDIGTYSKEKYKGRGAAQSGAADFVRIRATSIF